jgi:hypothetical protein
VLAVSPSLRVGSYPLADGAPGECALSLSKGLMIVVADPSTGSGHISGQRITPTVLPSLNPGKTVDRLASANRERITSLSTCR